MFRPIVYFYSEVSNAVEAQFFLDLTAPTFLYGINGSAISKACDCRLALAVNAEIDRLIIESLQIEALKACISVEIQIADLTGDHKNLYSRYGSKTNVSNTAYEANACLVLLDNASVFSIEFYDALTSAVLTGVESLSTPYLRVPRKTVAALTDHNGIDVVKLTSRFLVDFALKQYSQFDSGGDSFIDASVNGEHGSINFKIDNATLLQKNWTFRPVAFRPQKAISPEQASDRDLYFRALGLTHTNDKIIDDSDYGFTLIFDHEFEIKTSSDTKNESLEKYISWASNNKNKTSLRHFQSSAYVHSTDLNHSTESTQRFIKKISNEIEVRYLERTSAVCSNTNSNNFSSLAKRLLINPCRTLTKKLLRPVKKVLRISIRSFIPYLVCRFMSDVYVKRVDTDASDPKAQDISKQIFDKGYEQLDAGNLNEAAAFMNVSVAFSETEESLFYAKLLTTLIELKAEAEQRGRQYRHEQTSSSVAPLVFAVVLWGKDYVEGFIKYTIRTLLASKNLPALRGRTCIFSIVTDQQSQTLLTSFHEFDQLKKFAQIEFFLFPHSLTKVRHYSNPDFIFYRFYGAIDHVSLYFAKSFNAHILFVVADALYSNGSLQNLLKYVELGYDVCVNASLVANRETVLPELDRLIAPDNSIPLDSRDLAKLCYQHRHDYISQRIVTDLNDNFDMAPRELYFPTDEGFTVHAIYQHPWIVSNRAISQDIRFNFFVVDFALIPRIFENNTSYSKLKVIEDSDEVLICHFATAKRKFATTGEPFNIKNFVATHLQSSPAHWHILKQRQLLRVDTGMKSVPDPSGLIQIITSTLRAVIHK